MKKIQSNNWLLAKTDQKRGGHLTNNFIIDHFDEYFEMVPAISDELKKEVYSLRYQIFCIENQVFNSENYPDNLEFDDYDKHSFHYLIRHRKSGEYAATTRLILPDANNPKKLFPLELHCEIDNLAALQPINRLNLAEISRFGISKAFKKRKNEAQSLSAIGSNWEDAFLLPEQRAFPHITLALIACFIKASYENDIHYLYAGTEQSLLRLVSGWGINFSKIGPLANFHGKRWPCLIKVTDLLDGVAERNLDIWSFLTNAGFLGHPSSRRVNNLYIRTK